MHWSGERKETSIKQIEFKSFGKAGSQRVSAGNGRFMLHLYNHVASRCSLLTRAQGLRGAVGAGGQRGAGSRPSSHPRSRALDQRTSPFIFLTRRRDPKTLPDSLFFPLTSAAPAKTPETPGPSHPHFGSSQVLDPPGPFFMQPLAEPQLLLCLALLASIEQLTLPAQER